MGAQTNGLKKDITFFTALTMVAYDGWIYFYKKKNGVFNEPKVELASKKAA